VVVVDPVVVLVEQIVRGVDERGLHERRARGAAVDFLVVVADHGGAPRHERVRHRGAAEVLELVVERVAPAGVLEEAVLGIGRRVVAVLVEIGVAGQHPRSRRHDVGLDPPVVGRAAARESRHLLGVAGARVALQGLRRE
jgi:hypothetical protein